VLPVADFLLCLQSACRHSPWLDLFPDPFRLTPASPCVLCRVVIVLNLTVVQSNAQKIGAPLLFDKVVAGGGGPPAAQPGFATAPANNGPGAYGAPPAANPPVLYGGGAPPNPGVLWQHSSAPYGHYGHLHW
jgi:hypothetical protein